MGWVCVSGLVWKHEDGTAINLTEHAPKFIQERACEVYGRKFGKRAIASVKDPNLRGKEFAIETFLAPACSKKHTAAEKGITIIFVDQHNLDKEASPRVWA